MGVEKEFQTSLWIPVKEVYTSAEPNEIGFNEARDLGLPGTHPFVRGIVPSMYRGNLWTMGQYNGYGTAEDSNRRYKYLIELGASCPL